jgi:prevent-host-death family protein
MDLISTVEAERNLEDVLNLVAKQRATKVSCASLRGKLRERIGTLADAGKRVIVTRNGTELAALVPVRDIQKLVGLDDDIDLQTARRLLDQQLGRE